VIKYRVRYTIRHSTHAHQKNSAMAPPFLPALITSIPLVYFTGPMELWRFAAYYCCNLISLSLLEVVGEMMKKADEKTSYTTATKTMRNANNLGNVH
jgi:hypothetical protein